MAEKRVEYHNVNLPTTIFLILFFLKALGISNISWWWVFSPMWITIGLIIIGIIIVGIMALLYE